MTNPTNAEPVTPPVDDDVVEIRDFTLVKKRIRFRIDGDVFEAHTVLGVPLMQQLVRLGKTIGDAEDDSKIEAVYDVFDSILLPDSARRFRDRASSTGEDAIDAQRQLIPIIHYILEKHGIRPTQPSSDSPTG